MAYDKSKKIPQSPSIIALHNEYNENYASRVKALYGTPRKEMESELEKIFAQMKSGPVYQSLLKQLGPDLVNSTFALVKSRNCDEALDHAMAEGIDAELARAFGEARFAELQNLRKLADKAGAPQAAKSELKKLFMDNFSRSKEYSAVRDANPETAQASAQTFYQAAKAYIAGDDEILIPYISAARAVVHPEPAKVPVAQSLEQRVEPSGPETQDILNKLGDDAAKMESSAQRLDALFPDDAIKRATPEDPLVAYRQKCERVEQSLTTAAEALGHPGAPGYHANPADRRNPFYEKIVIPLLDSAEMRKFSTVDKDAARDYAIATIRGLANVAGISLTDEDVNSYALHLYASPKTEDPQITQASANNITEPIGLSKPDDSSTKVPEQSVPATADQSPAEAPVILINNTNSQGPAPEQVPVYQSHKTPYQAGTQRTAVSNGWFSEPGCGKLMVGAAVLIGAAGLVYVLAQKGCAKKETSKPEADIVNSVNEGVNEGSLEDQVLNSVFAGNYPLARSKFQLLVQTDPYKALAAQIGWNGKNFDDMKFNAAEAALPNVAQASYDVFDDTVGETKKGVDPVTFEIEFRKLESELLAMTQRDKLTYDECKKIRQLALARMIEQLPKLED